MAVAPAAVAVFGFGVSFGVLAAGAGLGALAPLVMSMTTFAGGAQFAAVAVISAGGGLPAAALAAVLVNGRFLPIGISVAPALRGGRWARLLAAQLVVDESWAVGHVGEGRYDGGRLIGAGLVVYAAWVGGTAAGTVAGPLLGDPARLGLDAAFPAMFLALLLPQLGSREARRTAILAAAVTLALTPFTPPGVPLLAAAACVFAPRGRR